MTGISNHSEDRTLLIYSTYLKHRDEVINIMLHTSVARLVKGLKTVVGSYRGDRELSFVKEQEFEGEAQDLAITFSQESVLKLINHKHGTYKAYLVSQDGNEDFIGYFRSVSAEVALKQEGWSLIDGVYYIVTDSDETCIDKLFELGLHS